VQVQPSPQQRRLLLERAPDDLLADLCDVAVAVAVLVDIGQPGVVGGRADNNPINRAVQKIQMDRNH
jgi:hypothetical protein